MISRRRPPSGAAPLHPRMIRVFGGLMAKPVRDDFESRLDELQNEHRRALKGGDIEALERIQTKLDELLASRDAAS
jgi:hypothetical protein